MTPPIWTCDNPLFDPWQAWNAYADHLRATDQQAAVERDATEPQRAMVRYLGRSYVCVMTQGADRYLTVEARGEQGELEL